MDHKGLTRVEIKDADKGEVTAIFATLDVIDSDGDVTVKGAFENGAPVRISAYGHASWNGALPVGKGSIREVGKEAVMDGQFFMDTAAGRDTFTVVKELGAEGLQEWSYGYDPVEYKFGEFEGRDVRFLEKLKVHEVSPVLLGAGVGTRLVTAKSGLTFADHAEAVLADLDAFSVRAAEVVALRAAKGKAPSEEFADRLRRVAEAAKRIEDVLARESNDPPDDQAARDLVAQQLARYVALTQGVPA